MNSDQLRDKLSSSFIVFENELNGERRSPLHQKRRAAMERFELKGFPSTRDEEWKYPNLKPLRGPDYKIFHEGEQSLEFREIKRFFLNDIDTYKIVFVNGKYSSWLSETTHRGFDICTFSAALQRHRHVLDEYFGRSDDEPSSTMDLNTAFAQEGAFIRIGKNAHVDKPVEIVHFTTADAGPSFNQPRNLIVLEEGSSAEVIERHRCLGEQETLTNAVSEVFLGAQARLSLFRIQNDAPQAGLIDHTNIHLSRDAHAHTATFSMGGRFVRNDLAFFFNEPNATAQLDGLSLLDGGEFADQHTLVDHRVPHCESREFYKGVYGGAAKGVFNGRVMVRPKAQKTNAFQENKNLLLSEKAAVDTKPQLEIFADDVKCSHGCTVGQLDEEALFYLRSRGIPEHESKALLLYAFGDEVIQRVPLKALRQRLHRLMAQKLDVDFQLNL